MGISPFSEKALKAPKSRCQGRGAVEELPGLIPMDAGNGAGNSTDPVWLSGANEPRFCTGVSGQENAGGVDFSLVGDSRGRLCGTARMGGICRAQQNRNTCLQTARMSEINLTRTSHLYISQK